MLQTWCLPVFYADYILQMYIDLLWIYSVLKDLHRCIDKHTHHPFQRAYSFQIKHHDEVGPNFALVSLS